MAFKKVKVVIKPQMVVRVSFIDNKPVGLVAMPQETVDQWELSNPQSYQAIISMIDSGQAVVTDKDHVAWYDPNVAWKPFESLKTISPQELDEITHKRSGEFSQTDINMNVYDYSFFDDDNLTSYERMMQKAIGQMGSEVAPEVSSDVKDDFMNPPIAKKDESALWVAPKDSKCIMTAKILGQKIYTLPESSLGGFTAEIDSRYPTKYIPTLFNEKLGWSTLNKDDGVSGKFTEIITDDTEGLVFRFRSIETSGYTLYPDVLSCVLCSNPSIAPNLSLTGRVTVAVSGIANMFSNQDPEEKKDKLISLYKEFFMNSQYFNITNVSWSTGFIQAVTPDYKPVLLYAALRDNEAPASDTFTFIPIFKSIGLAVVGLDKDHIDELFTKIKPKE